MSRRNVKAACEIARRPTRCSRPIESTARCVMKSPGSRCGSDGGARFGGGARGFQVRRHLTRHCSGRAMEECCYQRWFVRAAEFCVMSPLHVETMKCPAVPQLNVVGLV